MLGFYYDETYTDNNLQYAILVAIALTIVANLLASWRSQLVSSAVMLNSGICAYGFAFITGIRAINLIVASLVISGTIWAGVCIFYLGLTVNNLITGGKIFTPNAKGTAK